MANTMGLRQALRGLWRRPMASATAVMTLALALAASAVLLLVAHALYLAPLPFPNGERMHAVHGDMGKIGIPEAGMSWTLAREVEQLPTVAALAAWQTEQVALSLGEFPESVRAVRAEAALFDVLGAGTLERGRAFTQAEVDAGEAVVVVGHGFALERFGSIEAALDAPLQIDGSQHRVIGVFTAGIGFPHAERQLLLPLPRPAATQDVTGGFGSIQTVVRRTEGADDGLMAAQLDALVARLASDSAEFAAMLDITGLRLSSIDWRASRAGDRSGTLVLLSMALAGLLLLAGSTVSNLLMERFASRRGELAVRVALGASRARLIRLVLVEACLLSLAGWLVGIALCALLLSTQQQWPWLDLPTGTTLTLAWPPLFASLLLTAALSLLTALFPAWLASRMDGECTDLSQRGGTDGAALRARRLLVVTQSAISIALLVVSALLGRSLYQLWQVDPGFQQEGVLSAQIEPRGVQYESAGARLALAQQLLDQTAQLPGVQAVGLSGMLPFGSNYSMASYEVEGRTQPEQPPVALSSSASSGYLRAMSIPLLRGRWFERGEDQEVALPVAVIDQRLARLHFADGDPIGQRLRLGPGEWLQIVGVVGAVQQLDLADAQEHGHVYLPIGLAAPKTLYLAMSTQLPMASVVPGLRHLLRSIDAGLPLLQVMPMDQRVGASLSDRAGPLGIVGFFAGVAVLLAGIGLYGLLATAVIERRPEIGVRLALGAQRHVIIHSVVADGLRLVVIGIVAGLGLTALTIPLLRHHLHGVTAADPLSYGMASALLLAIALIAIAFPAWRAARVPPAQALRNE